MVIPPAIGAADDLHAWLIRGWVESGLPDVTLGGGLPPGGGFSAESLRLNGGAEGLELRFYGFEADDEWVYHVVVTGPAVAVACPDTLFSHAYAGIPARELGARILADVRAHNEAFLAWRQQGGQPGLGETRAIRVPPGVPASRTFLELADRRYGVGGGFAEGPANGWWVVAHSAAALGGAITTGSGVDPTYRLKGEVPVHERPEYREYAASLRRLGGWLVGLSAASGFLAAAALFWFGFNIFQQRAEIVLMRDVHQFSDLATQNAYPLLGFLSVSLFAGCWLVAGLRLRALANLTLIRVLLVIACLPCTGGCCFAGLPLGGWVLYRLTDPKAAAIFGRGR